MAGFDERIIAFLRGTGTDASGRLHADVLSFTDNNLEITHDYIQWLFPLRTKSAAVPGSPFIENDNTVTILHNDLVAQVNIHKAMDRMLNFYRNNDHWLQPQDHNHLRITRIIKSAKLILSHEDAARFYQIITLLNSKDRLIDPENMKYWKAALEE